MLWKVEHKEWFTELKNAMVTILKVHNFIYHVRKERHIDCFTCSHHSRVCLRCLTQILAEYDQRSMIREV